MKNTHISEDQIYLNLINQFISAEGINSKDLKSRQFFADFSEWVRIRQNIGKQYIRLLDQLELEFYSSECAEIGKCGLDSIVKPFNTTIITQVDKIIQVDPKRIIKGDFKVKQSIPVLEKYDLEGNPKYIDLRKYFKIYMTQNPYSEKSILGWENLHNSRGTDTSIICGVYGKIYDKDIKGKIAQLNELKSKLKKESFVSDYEEDNDNYFYVIASENDRLGKTYEKVLSR